MHIVQNGSNYEVSFEYDAVMVEAIKRIPGKKWIPGKKMWLIPISEEAKVMRFYKRFSKLAANSDAPMVTGVIPELPELNAPIPLRRPLFPFQERGTAFCLQGQGAGIMICDKPGLGKTSQAIAAVVAANRFPCLVVCPKTLRNNWAMEWDVVAGRNALILDENNRGNWWKYYEKGRADVFIVNYDQVKQYFIQSINIPPGESMLVKHIMYKEQVNMMGSFIIDESHFCKDVETQRTKFVIGLTRGKKWVFAMSGTPVVNKTIDLLAQLCIVNRIEDLGGITYFKERYCKDNTYLPELQYKLLTTCMYQRRKEEVLTDLPPKIRQKMMVDITTRKEYNDALESLADYLRQYKQRSDEQIQKSMQGEIMVRIGICKAISARGKLEAAFEQIRELNGAGEKVVIFIHQKVVAEALMAHFPHFVTIRGSDDSNHRNNSIKEFQGNPGCMGIICSIKAGGVGTTLTKSRYVLMLELPWHAADCEQCEDRTHRIGQPFQVHAMYFIGHRTIDEQIYQLIEEKRALGDQITGGEDVTQEEIIDRITNSLFSGMTI